MTFDAVNRAAVVATTVLLAVGLGVWLWRGPSAADRLFDAGLIALMLTPVLRLVTTLAADIRRRDTVAAATRRGVRDPRARVDAGAAPDVTGHAGSVVIASGSLHAGHGASPAPVTGPA